MKKSDISLKRTFAANARAVRLLHGLCPQFFPVTALYALVSGIAPYVTVFFSSRILRELATQRRADTLWTYVLLGTICTGLCAVIGAALKQRQETLLHDVWNRKDFLYSEKLFVMDYADVDRQETHDLLAQIRQNEGFMGSGFTMLIRNFAPMCQSIVGLFSGIALTVRLFTTPVPAASGILAVLNSPTFVLLFAVILILVDLLAGTCVEKAYSYNFGLTEKATFGNRIFGQFGFYGMKRDPGRHPDIRIYSQQDLIDFYTKKDSIFSYKGLYGQMCRGPMGLYYGLSTAVSALATGFIYVFTCLKALGGAFDIGSITQYVGAATAMAGNLYTLIEQIGVAKNNTPYLELAYKLLDMPNAMYQGSLTTEKRSDRQYEVEFRNVSFRYPGSEMWALKDVSLKFRVGSRLAIVGENGSGKTTFIKLLCRLYDPQEGQILLNGIDIRKYNYRDYMGIFSVVFQDFQLLSQSLGSNVAGSTGYDEARVCQALRNAGFGERLATMPQGLDTQLYKDFGEDGVQVSGGEAQKIAIARALYKDAPFIILDEPTAALDPIAEAEIYSRFNDIAGDKTAVYISHRLSSCKFCDEIAVFDHGQIIQHGTHANLLALGSGKYYDLWTAQAQYYTKEGTEESA